MSASSYGGRVGGGIHCGQFQLRPAPPSGLRRRIHMTDSPASSGALQQIAAHLGQRRDAILAAWRRAVDADPELTTASTTSRAQFVDHIPAVLDAFEQRLAAPLARA